MTEIRYWTQLATEQFGPEQLISQAQAAEKAGFDALNVSDHYQPWWEPGESAHAWVMLGAIGQATRTIPIGTGVTAPVFRHNPAVVAQAFATLEAMLPGRAYVGIGSGESLNESPCGMDWPSVGEQIERMEEALEIIGRLFDGERLDFEGRYFKTKAAYLHTRGERRPPIYVSAFGAQAAGVAARLGDGVWTLPIAPRARTPARNRVRSSSRADSPGRRTTTPRSREPVSGRAPSPWSTSATTGTTPRRCTRTASARSRTTSSARPTSSRRTRASTPTASVRSSGWARRSCASRMRRARIRSERWTCTATRCCRRSEVEHHLYVLERPTGDRAARVGRYRDDADAQLV
jgi:alkanesulfonate monooxygenase SsuD/methylene tetrahydromethanopterin reductase-like flavin-dependent oxidoreductase (luciferase family)